MTAVAETKFVVLTDNRSGSTWLMSMLNSFAHVEAQGELFLSRPRSPEKRWDSEFARPRFIEARADHPSLRPFSVFFYLDDLYATPGTVGFKLMYAQLLRYPEILGYFLRHRTRVVHLVRRNHLDVVLSYTIKAKLGQAHLLSGQAPAGAMSVDLDTKNLIQRLQWLQRKQVMAQRVLAWCKLTHLEVAYEDLLGDPARFDPVWDFLDIEPKGDVPESTLVKIARGTHHDVIRNYDEVKRVMARSKFVKLLE